MKLMNNNGVRAALISVLLVGSSLSVNAETFTGNRLALKAIKANLSLSLNSGLLDSKGIYLDKESTEKFEQHQILNATVKTSCEVLSEKLQLTKEAVGENLFTKPALDLLKGELDECLAKFAKIEQYWKTEIAVSEESLKAGPKGEPAMFSIVEKTEINTTDKTSLIRIKQSAKEAGPVYMAEVAMNYEPAMEMNPILQVNYRMVNTQSQEVVQRSFQFKTVCKETHIFDTILGVKIPFKAPEKTLTCTIPDGRGEVKFQILN